MKRISFLFCLFSLAAFTAAPAFGQAQLRSSADLDQMLGPIALYPDPLIAQMMPAATFPAEITQADQYLTGGGDPNLAAQQPWDSSVQALLRYPTVLKWMDENMAWTTAVGEAFVAQQEDVMASIQRLRASAQSLGNLASTPQESVTDDSGEIEIAPANPETIYVPVYDPAQVFFQRPFGAPFISFGVGFAVGGWLDHDFDWHQHHLIIWDRDHPRPVTWWQHRPGERPPIHAGVWQPHERPGLPARPLDRGWEAPRSRPTPVVVHERTVVQERRPEPVVVHERPVAPERRPAPVVVSHPAPVIHSQPATGAFIGVRSSHETQQISNRGQQSRQSTPRPPPARVVSRPPAGKNQR